MNKKRVIILGAGLAGLSAAWHLKKRGIEYLVFEKEGNIGGLCRSKHINGFTFDLGGHLLHFKHRYVFDLLKDLLGNNLAQHRRDSWVYSHGKYIPYPFQANLSALPSAVVKDCLFSFMAAAAAKVSSCTKKNHTFFNWINNTFGKGIARHFMIPYNTKFWTVNPKSLTCEWLDGFIPVPSANQIV
ncbi:MAG: FAD-dependent oxidoreductase [Candidatus Omnitrophica bacterium]|nr:FAD-dependent oxidoreductase [Candidatus Omnitrophota bacterium]